MLTRASVAKTILVTVVPEEMKDKVVAALIAAARSPAGGQIGMVRL